MEDSWGVQTLRWRKAAQLPDTWFQEAALGILDWVVAALGTAGSVWGAWLAAQMCTAPYTNPSYSRRRAARPALEV